MSVYDAKDLLTTSIKLITPRTVNVIDSVFSLSLNFSFVTFWKQESRYWDLTITGWPLRRTTLSYWWSTSLYKLTFCFYLKYFLFPHYWMFWLITEQCSASTSALSGLILYTETAALSHWSQFHAHFNWRISTHLFQKSIVLLFLEHQKTKAVKNRNALPEI